MPSSTTGVRWSTIAALLAAAAAPCRAGFVATAGGRALQPSQISAEFAHRQFAFPPSPNSARGADPGRGAPADEPPPPRADGVVAGLYADTSHEAAAALGRLAARRARRRLLSRGQGAAAAAVADGRVASMGVATLGFFGAPDALPAVRDALWTLASVVSVEWHEPAVAANCRAAARLGSGSCDAQGSPDADLGPLAALGADGSALTVGIVDTGLATGHCRYSQQTVSHASVDVQESGAEDICGRQAPGPAEAAGADVVYLRYTCTGRSWCQPYVTDHGAVGPDHGTHVAGTVRDGSRARTVMIDAQLTRDSALGTMTMPPNFSAHVLEVLHRCNHARVLSFSWSSSTSGRYTYLDRTIDYYAWTHPTVLVVAAAGNYGSAGAGRVSSPGTAKNALSVGALLAPRSFYDAAHAQQPSAAFAVFWKDASALFASPARYASSVFSDGDDHARPVMDFSSVGPTADGRQKPELSAVGSYLRSDYAGAGGSCAAGDRHVSMQGTSMAAPAVAAAATQVAHLFGACAQSAGCRLAADAPMAAPLSAGDASSSLVKALLVLCADPVTHEAYAASAWTAGAAEPLLQLFRRGLGRRAALDAAGFGELRVGRALLGAGASTFAYGESAARSFPALRSASSAAGEGFDTTLAAQLWTGDGALHSACYRTTRSTTRVRAALSWRDYPSVSQCAHCLSTDLALSVYTLGDRWGGAAAELNGNLEVVDQVVRGAQQTVKVTVHAVYVTNPAVDAQPYSLAVAGAGLEPLPDCDACSLGTEVEICTGALGVGERYCADGAPSGECDVYAHCYAASDADPGRPTLGLTSQDCASLHGAGRRGGCLASAFPTADRRGCATLPCRRERSVRFADDWHVCPRGQVHDCAALGNATHPANVTLMDCVAAATAPAADGAAPWRLATGDAAAVGVVAVALAACAVGVCVAQARSASAEDEAPGDDESPPLLAALLRRPADRGAAAF